ncbi:MAG: RluA family pseudouridine synthase [Hellea sp.]|nr:RluA family pseudouridine synthase [Hellea sp.]
MKAFQYNPPTEPIEIIHQDDDILLVDKPSGLLSVPGKGDEHKDCLETRLRDIYPELLLVHRLDHPTSGIIIFARNKHAQRHLGLQFEKRQTEKRYIARVWGQVDGASGHVNLPLRCDWPNRPRQMVCFEHGKSAQTDWELMERNDQSSRLALYPKTGRSHQLRVHCQAMGHPILGDSFYASGKALEAAKRLQLHAEQLKFRHPVGGAWMSLTAPCPF